MTISRRGFLMGAAALPALSAMSWTTDAVAAPVPLPRDADVVVIGAGVAGIAAARKIAAAGRRVVVIEATSRIGGRCVTDTATFDAPFDRGARWLHLPDGIRSQSSRARRFDLYPAPQGQKIRIGRRDARASETEDFLTTLVRVNRAIGDASRGGRADVAADTVIPRDARRMGADTRLCCALYDRRGFARDIGHRSRPRRRAQSSLVLPSGSGRADRRSFSEPVPFILSTPVSRIAWRDNGADIETSAGKVAARTVIVAAADPNVLAANAHWFCAGAAAARDRRAFEAQPRHSRSRRARPARQSAGHSTRRGRDREEREASAPPCFRAM